MATDSVIVTINDITTHISDMLEIFSIRMRARYVLTNCGLIRDRVGM